MKSETTEQRANGIGRRGFMRKIGVGVGTTAAIGTGAIRLDHGPVGNSQAIAPAVAAGAVGASVATGWALREFEVIGSDSPSEGLTADALQNETFNTLRARSDNLQSTYVDNKNILEFSEDTLFSEGKIDAIDALNDQKSQSEVEQAAKDAVIDRALTIEDNLVTEYEQMVYEIDSYLIAVQDHSDLEVTDVVELDYDGSNDYELTGYAGIDEETIDSVDGSERTYDSYEIEREGGDDDTRTQTILYDSLAAIRSAEFDVDATLPPEDFGDLHLDLQDMVESVNSNLEEWVDNVYDEVQSGSIDTGELLTPREMAELTSEDEQFNQAVSDLQAMNVATDLEREAEIHLPEIDATVYGTLAYSGTENLQVGMVDPAEKDGSIYITYDMSESSGMWTDYETGVDGGVVTFTAEPYDDSIYLINTKADETAQVHSDDFEHDDENNEWTVDVSDQLDDQIVDIDDVEFFADVDETRFQTSQLTDEFEIISFTDSEGNEYDEADFERSEPHTNDNYITQEEWEEQQERHEELIEQYEESQGGAGILPGFENIGDIPAEYIAAAAAVVGGAALFGNSG